MAVNKSLAITSFMSEPDDSLATADVYTVSTDDVINNLPTIDSSVEAGRIADLEEGMRGGASMTEGLPLKSDSALAGIHALQDKAAEKTSLFSLSSLKSVAATALKTGAGALSLTGSNGFGGASLLSKITGSGMSGIPGLSKNSLGSLTSAIAGNQIPGVLKNSLNLPLGNTLGSTMSLGGITNRIAPGNQLGAMQMTSLLGAVAPVLGGGSASFVDKDSSVRLISGLANAALSTGITSGFSQSASLAGGNKSILTQAATLVLKSAASMGSVAGMKDVTKTYSAAYGSSSSLYASNPNVLNDLSTNYKKPLPIGTTVYNGPSVNSEFTDTMDTFNDINPSWNSSTRNTSNGSESSFNLSTIANGNSDFRSMMMQGVRQSPDSGDSSSVKFMALATQFSPEPPEKTLARGFPNTVTSVNTVTTSDESGGLAAWMAQDPLKTKYGDLRDDPPPLPPPPAPKPQRTITSEETKPDAYGTGTITITKYSDGTIQIKGSDGGVYVGLQQ